MVGHVMVPATLSPVTRPISRRLFGLNAHRLNKACVFADFRPEMSGEFFGCARARLRALGQQPLARFRALQYLRDLEIQLVHHRARGARAKPL